MPVILSQRELGQAPERNAQTIEQAPEYRYSYPPEVGGSLSPKRERHRKLFDMIWERAADARHHMHSTHQDWLEVDRVLRGYVRTQDYERWQKEKGRQDSRNKPTPVLPQIIMPTSRANLETMMTYMVSAFLRDPMLRYRGIGPEDVPKAMLMQHHVNQHVKRQQIGLKLYTQIQDSLKYGVGYAAPVWTTEYGLRARNRRRGVVFDAINAFLPRGSTSTLENGIIYEGNDYVNINPYNLIIDPNAPAHEPEKAEFFGWLDKSNKMEILHQEENDPDLFNAKYLNHIDDGRSVLTRLGADRKNKNTRMRKGSTNNPVDVLWMYVHLIPQQWDLGPGQYPEWWLFRLAADSVIIEAHPVRLAHGTLPIVPCVPDFDGYSSTVTSKMMSTYDLQVLIDFLYGSHITNIRKALNDMFVVDPSLVNVWDLLNPGPGKLVRTRRRQWGKGNLDSVIKQLDVRDVTASHVADALQISEFTQEALGTTDAVRGVVRNRGPRISATAAQQATSSSLSRLQKNAVIISMQTLQPMAKFFAWHTMDLMEEDAWIEASGDFLQTLTNTYGWPEPVERNGRMLLSPQDLIGNYDIEFSNYQIPGSEDLEKWVELYSVAAENPVIAQNVNFVELFKHLAMLIGAKDVEKFIVQGGPQVVPDEQVDQQAQQGNLVPVGGDGAAAV